MKSRPQLRPKLIIVLRLAAIAVNVFLVFFLLRLDQVVHGDLYSYGLQFNYEWAVHYWTYAKLMLGLLGFSTAITALCIALTLAGPYTYEISLLRKARILLKTNPTKLICPLLISFGVIALAFSIYYTSSILALIGLGLVFWGALFLYMTPTKHIKLELLNATSLSTLANIEKVIANTKSSARGIYLPPKYLKDFESSLIFIPSKVEQTLPKPEEVEEEKLYSENTNGLFLTPTGLALTKLLEKELGTSFARTDLNYLQESLPRLFVEDTEMVENLNVLIENNIITVELTNHLFKDICEETRKHQKLHESIGCPLCSAIACILAKATGKPIRIKKEEQGQEGKSTKIQYEILEE